MYSPTLVRQQKSEYVLASVFAHRLKMSPRYPQNGVERDGFATRESTTRYATRKQRLIWVWLCLVNSQARLGFDWFTNKKKIGVCGLAPASVVFYAHIGVFNRHHPRAFFFRRRQSTALINSFRMVV